MYYKFLAFFNRSVANLKKLKTHYWNEFLDSVYFFKQVYLTNNFIWQEGLFLDFLQKKWADNWIRKFLIYSANLFNERAVFDKITRFYLDYIIWPMHRFSFFVFDNVSNTLVFTLFFFLLFFFIFILYYFFILMF